MKTIIELLDALFRQTEQVLEEQLLRCTFGELAGLGRT